MSHPDAYLNDFDDYDELYNPAHQERQSRRRRKPRVNPKDRKTRREAVNDVADVTAMEAGFEMTYTPARHEEGWLQDSLKAFYDMALLTDVLAMVKGGKEASVYRCQGHPDSAVDRVAAKVYRPRMFRNLRKDHMYRQGREILTPDGRPVGLHGDRVAHAIRTRSAYGLRAAHTSWLMYEYTTLQTLYQAGAAVPEPYGASANAILMGYVGDDHGPAPTLHEVTLEPDEVEPLFMEVLRNIELMLQYDVIHGDLSAYNVLYWDGAITLIDFPQVVNPHSNPIAHEILQRDITRVCEYFAGYGVESDPAAIMEALWTRYIGMTPAQRAAQEALFLSEPESDDNENESEDW